MPVVDPPFRRFSFTRRSTYTWRVWDGYLVVIDTGGPLSVTNDAEAVIRDLAEEVGDVDVYRVIYCDSDGRWDGMLTAGGKFSDYRLLNARSAEEARAQWIAKWGA